MKVNHYILIFLIFQSFCGLGQLKVDAGGRTKVCLDAHIFIGGTPTAINGTPNYSYSWQPEVGLSCTTCANPAASPTKTTTYFVTVTDEAGNVATDSVLVELSEQLEILTPTDTLCRAAACMQLQANVNGGIWAGVGVTGNLFCPANAGGGTKTITYTVNMHPTCAGTAMVQLPLKRNPNLDISVSNDTICFGKEIIIQNKSAEKESYQWFINDIILDVGFNNNSFNMDITDAITKTGTYTIVQKLIDHPCPAADTLVLRVKRQANFGFEKRFTGPCGRSYYIENKSRDRTLTYNWDFGDGTKQSIFQPDTLFFKPAVSGKDTFYRLSISVEDAICDDTEITADLFVGYRPMPKIEALRLSTDTLCGLIDTLTLSCNLDLNDAWLDSLQWSLGTYGTHNGSNLISSQLNLAPVIFDKRNLSGLTTDTITLITYGRCGSDSITYLLNLNYASSTVTAAFETNQALYCVGDTVHLNNTSDSVPTYFWDFDNGIISTEKNPFHIFNEAGNYIIQLTAAEICSATTTAQEILVVAYPNNTTINYLPAEPLTQQAVTLIANFEEEQHGNGYETHNYVYEWNLGDFGASTEQMPMMYFNRPGDYLVELLISPVEASCPILLSTSLSVELDIIIHDFFPTAFSPNADGINDCYEVELPYYLSLELLQIYDRWGNLLFETPNNDVCWNGKLNNKALSIGVYVYQAVLRDVEDEVYQLRGNITLVR